jgi:hypothetical protein
VPSQPTRLRLLCSTVASMSVMCVWMTSLIYTIACAAYLVESMRSFASDLGLQGQVSILTALLCWGFSWVRSAGVGHAGKAQQVGDGDIKGSETKGC